VYIFFWATLYVRRGMFKTKLHVSDERILITYIQYWSLFKIVQLSWKLLSWFGS